MPRGNTDLTSTAYDTYLSSKNTKGARRELAQRHAERRNAHDNSGVGYHFGLGKDVVKVESKAHLKHELDKRGLMLETEVQKNLRGPGKHEFTRGR